jgi:hypothetical protein
MAGFAVVMTFLFWGFMLSVVALLASILLYRNAKRISPQSTRDAYRYRYNRAAAPFLAILWIAIALILHTIISNKLGHQSVGFSPDPYVTLPNGYVVGSLNTYSGYVHAPGVQTDIPWVGTGYVRGIIDLSYNEESFAGTYLDSRSDFQPKGTDRIRGFVFDTRDQSIKTFDTKEAADFETQQNRVHEDATSYWNLYAKYRHRWPTEVFWIILLGGEIGVVVLYFRLKPPDISAISRV